MADHLSSLASSKIAYMAREKVYQSFLSSALYTYNILLKKKNLIYYMNFWSFNNFLFL